MLKDINYFLKRSATFKIQTFKYFLKKSEFNLNTNFFLALVLPL